MKKSILIIIAVLTVIVGLVLIAPSFVDWSKFKEPILDKLEDATGLEYSVADIDFALLPFPRLALEGIDVHSPSMTEAPLLTLQELAVQVDIKALLKGEVIVNSILLSEPQVTLSVDKDGRFAFMTPEIEKTLEGSGEAKSSGADIGHMISLNEVKIKKGHFRFIDWRSDKDITIDDLNVVLKADTLSGPFTVNGDFHFQDDPVKFSLQSGRLDKLAESVALQANVSLSEKGVDARYSGVVALDKKIEAQGEAAFSVSNLGKALQMPQDTVLSGKSFAAKGILSFDGEKISYDNLSLDLGDIMSSKGHIRVNLPDKINSVVVDVALEALKPVNADVFVKAEGGKQNVEKSSDPFVMLKQPFLPDSLTLPISVSGAVSYKAPSVTWQKHKLDDVVLSIQLEPKQINADLKAKTPGQGTIVTQASLRFKASSQTETTGQVILSEPTLKVTNYLKTEDGRFVAPDLSGPLALQFDADIKPRDVKVDNIVVALEGLDAEGGLSYKQGSAGKKGALSLSLQGGDWNLDRWVKDDKKSAGDKPKGRKESWDELSKSLKLPFDVDFDVSVGKLAFQGNNLKNLAMAGGLQGDYLSVKAASVESSDGLFAASARTDVQNVSLLQGVDATLGFKTKDLPGVLKAYNVDTSKLPKSLKSFEVSADLKGSGEALSYTVNGEALKTRVEAQGALGSIWADNISVSKLTTRLRHPDFEEFMKIFSEDFKGAGKAKMPVDLFARVESVDDGSFNIPEVKLGIGETKFNGSLSVKPDKTRPEIKANLSFDVLNVRDFVPQSALQYGGKAKVTTQTSDMRWSRNAIDTAWMHGMDLDIKADGKTLIYDQWRLSNPVVEANLKKGTLDLSRLEAGVLGGQLKANGTVQSSEQPRQPLQVKGAVSLDNVMLESFVQTFSGSKVLRAKGTVSLQTDLETTGLSPAALVFDLKGKGIVKSSDLVLLGFDLGKMGQALAQAADNPFESFSALLNASTSGGSTIFDSLDGPFTVQEGVILMEKWALLGPAASVQSTGNVNLPLWTVDLNNTIKLSKPVDAPPLTVSFEGPLDKPGKTFGENALRGYFEQHVKKKVEDLLLKTLERKGILAPAPGTTSQQQPAEQNTAPQQQPSRQVTPEDALFGILEKVIR